MRSLPIVLALAVVALPASGAPRGAAGWRYTVTHDAMRGTSERAACIRSVNVIRQGFPYHSQRLNLCITSGMVTFSLPEGGQLATYNLTSVKIDDGPIVAYNTVHVTASPLIEMWSRGNFPSNGDDGGVKLSDRIAQGKRLTVEIEVYTGGIEQAIFNVAGLKP